MIRRAGLLICLLAVTATAAAQRERLDDSLSPQRLYSIDLEWQPQEIMRTIQAMLTEQDVALPPLTGYLNAVEVRLDTRSYIGHQARIWLRLPTAMPGTDGVGDIQLSWSGDGHLQDGSVFPGQEALLFEGTIEGPVTGGVLNFRLNVGADGAQQRFNLEPLYEIEIIS